MNKQEFKKALVEASGCEAQYDGWPCGTCFFSIDESLTNRDWQTVLWYRGDYTEEDLDNLPSLAVREGILEDMFSMLKDKNKILTL